MNSRIRNRGLSAKEIVLCRDQITHKPLRIDDNRLSIQQKSNRNQNHPSSAKSKARDAPLAADACVKVGSLVYIKAEGDKFNPREQYLITNILNGSARIQKCNSGKFMSKTYTVSLNRLFPSIQNQQFDISSSSSSEDGELYDNTPLVSGDTCSDDGFGNVIPIENTPSSQDEDEQPVNTSRRSNRERREPEWLRSSEWERN